MRFDLYSDPFEEQARLAAYASERRRKTEAKDVLTEEQVQSILDISKKFPWFSTSANVALHRAYTTREVIERAALLEARSKDEKRRTNGRKSKWSGIGDFVSDIAGAVGGASGAIDRAAGRAAGAVYDAGRSVDDVVLGAVASVASKAREGASDIYESGAFPTVGSNPQSKQARETAQEAGVLPSANELVTQAKGASRAALAAAQYPQEALVGTARRVVSGDYRGYGGLMVGGAPEDLQAAHEQTTIGAAQQIQNETGRVSLGSGWFPAGEAAKRQAQNARDALMVEGKAWTFGRGAASLIVEPGTTPYNILSGLVDAGVAWYGDPGAIGLTKAGRARQTAKALGGTVTETQLARAINKADPKWRAELEEAVGLVSGGRKTVVPRQVDKFLYSDGFRRIAERVASEPSPYNIWLAADKKMPVGVAQELSRIDDAAQVGVALRPLLGLDVTPGQFKGFGMQKVHSAQSQIRALNIVPDTWLPFDDPDAFVRNLDNSLANANVMGEERRAIMDVAFDALSQGGPGARKRLLNVASDAVRRSLVGYGVDDEIAHQLTSWTGDIDKTRHYLTNDAGEDVNFSFLTDADGNPVRRPQPAALIDLLNSGTFLYDPNDVRKIRTLTSKLRPLTTNIGFRLPHSTVNFLQQTLVKPLLPFRAAFFLRVEGESVARGLASGTFDSVLDWMHFGRSQRVDATGSWFDVAKEADDIAERLATETLDADTRKALKARLGKINEEIDEGKTAFDQVRVGRAWKYADFYAIEKNLHRSGAWTTVHKSVDPYRWVQGLADETIAMSQDPIIRRVANGGVFDGDKVNDARPGLDGIKDWLRSGVGQPFLRRLEDAYPGIDFRSEAVLDDIIDKARMRVEKLGDNADLREAVASGMLDGTAIAAKTKDGRVASDALRSRLREWADDPRSPNFTKYELAEKRGRVRYGDAEEFMDTFGVVMDNFYGHLYGRTTDYLSRERVFKGRYWREMENLAPYMTEAARDEMLVNAANARLSRARLKRLAEASKQPAGEADLEAADMLAKGRALDFSRNLLYDGRQKSQASDIFRAVFLYPEAWREVTGTWLKLAVDNPQIPRRAQQLVQGARGAGFFYRDDATGQEMFGYPMPGPLADYLGVEFQGSAQGLSLGTSVIPGLGPVASVTANRLIPHTPNMDAIRSTLFPYGEPGDLAGAAAPGWMKKLFGAGIADEDNDRVFGNTYVEVLRQLAASGKYGNSEVEKQRLMEDAIPKARAITAVRGLMQFIAPSAPQIRYLAEVGGRDAVVVALMTKELHELQEEDYDTAIERFLDKYGDEAFVFLVGKTQSTVGGQQASTEYGRWERENSKFIDTYDLVAGYFGPQGEGYNDVVFQRQEKQGRRKRRSGDEILTDAQNLVASWEWQQVQKQAAGRTDRAAMEWKRQVKTEIQADYPLWDPDAKPNRLPGRIRQLERAIKDERVRDQPVAQAIGEYFELRQQAVDAAKASGWSSPFQAKGAKYLRDWLRQVAGEIQADTPEFARVWDQVLRYELKEDEDG